MNLLALVIRPVRDAAPFEQAPPLSRTTGGRNLAHHMGQNSKRRRRPLWRLPRSVVDYWTSFAVIMGFILGLYWFHTWG